LPVAIRKLSGDCTLAAVTMGAEGAMAITNGEIISVPANPVPEVIDATGAGDLFAAGFLLGLSRERDLHAALTAGCLAASEVISHIGARPMRDLQQMAREHGVEV
jgi:sugar/nucleoside kinase (ribokinase family)